MRRVPLKGEPNFSNLTDEQVRQYKNMVTDLMGNFSELPDVTSALEVAWKYLCYNKHVDKVSEILTMTELLVERGKT